MIINFSPIRSDEKLSVELLAKDKLSLNGSALDLSSLPDNAVLPLGSIGSNWIAGPVTKSGGVVSITLLLPIGATAPESSAFPEPTIAVNPGIVEIPEYGDEEQAVE